MIRIVLADDQPPILKAFSTIIHSRDTMRVVATAANGAEAINACMSHNVDVVVMDIRMPVMDGITAARAILARHPHIRIVMLTTFDDPTLVREALTAGVHGFLLKDADPEIFLTAIEAIHSGESVLASGVTKQVIDTFRHAYGSDLSPEQRQGLSLITRREMDVLLRVAQGLTNAEISADLGIAETTVKTHITALLAKVHARDRVALVLFAHKAGLLLPR
ncbi:response regulator [Corynebacterium diphtheriae]|nr:DNA-binding response regulator [Corynebacterium diphtheriae]